MTGNGLADLATAFATVAGIILGGYLVATAMLFQLLVGMLAGLRSTTLAAAQVISATEPWHDVLIDLDLEDDDLYDQIQKAPWNLLHRHLLLGGYGEPSFDSNLYLRNLTDLFNRHQEAAQGAIRSLRPSERGESQDRLILLSAACLRVQAEMEVFGRIKSAWASLKQDQLVVKRLVAYVAALGIAAVLGRTDPLDAYAHWTIVVLAMGAGMPVPYFALRFSRTFSRILETY